MNKPARKIGITTRSVSGVVPGMGRYESSLERDFMELLRFDDSIRSFQAQPVTIDYQRKDGSWGKYTPDGYFEYAEHLALPPVLYEIKYRKDFRDDWKSLMPKFRAAKQYGLARGWIFQVFTENEIRTHYLDNIRFLFPYKSRPIADELKLTILTVLFDLQETDPDILLCALCRDKANRARLIPALWYLVSKGYIGIDLTVPLNMHSHIWPLEYPQ
jgi:hypothetical protein